MNKDIEDHLIEAWSSWRDELRSKEPEQRWKLVNGPTSAVIAHLWDWGWVPAFPSWWARPPGEAATVGRCGAADALLVQQITKAAEDAEWTKAARHHGGKGLEHGTPSFVCIDRALKACRKAKALQVATALRNVAAGGAICGSRFQPARTCFRCHKSDDTWNHKFYGCPGNSVEAARHALGDNNVSADAKFVISWLKETEYLSDYAEFKGYEPECLWARGLIPAQGLPSSLLPSDHEAVSFVTTVPGTFSEDVTLATDGTLLKDNTVWHAEAGRASAGMALIQ